MLIASYIIPVIAIIALFVFFKHKVAWWEALLLLVSSVIITLLVYLISKEISQADVEYYGMNVREEQGRFLVVRIVKGIHAIARKPIG